VLPCTDTLHGAAGLSACNPHGNCSAELGSAFLPACQLCAPGTTGTPIHFFFFTYTNQISPLNE
jgi:hypothetical protein